MYKKGLGKITTSSLKSQFDRYWLDSVNMTKTQTNQDPSDHNKLRTYRTYKSSFTREPYIDLIRNRNQKSSLTRLRTGSHFLGVEKGRWSRPVTPLSQRTCAYCSPPTTSASCSPPPASTNTSPPPPPASSSTSPPPPGPVDDELHFVMKCTRFDDERKIAFEEMSSLVPTFSNMSEQQKFKIFLCPTQPQTTKLANRLFKKMFDLREKIDQSKNCANVAMPND